MRGAGAAFGVGLALVLLLLARPGAAGSPLAAEVRVAVAPVGELEIVPPPPRPFLVADALEPGGRRAEGEVTVRNQTGSDLAAELRPEASSGDLDGLLRVRAWMAGRLLADTTLEGMRTRPPDLRLSSGERTRLRLQVWLPAQILSGYEGRLVEVSLVPELRTAGARR